MILDEYGNRRFYGVYRGVVVDTDDPLGKGRVRLQVPQVLSDAVTDWAWPKSVQGVHVQPVSGQGIWVEFEGGDPSYPVWGGVFGDDQTKLGAESIDLGLGDLNNVSVAGATDGQVLKYTAATGQWVPGTGGGSSITSLAALTDVNLTSPANGALLSYDSGTTKWIDTNDLTNVNSIQMNTSPTATRSTGLMWWDSTRETLQIGVGSASSLQVGQETHIYVRNTWTETIPDGTLVMSTGVTNNIIDIAPAITDGSVDGMYMLGITTQDIAKNTNGLVTTFGELHDQNTNAWNEGDVLWNNPAVPGGLTNVEPTAPALKLPVAIVTKKSGGSGVIFVRMTNGSKLGGTDSNVQFTTLTDKDLIVYNNATGIWTNKSPSTLSIATSQLTGTISNSQLANSSITIGTTSISLGGSTTSLLGVTSINNTTIPSSKTLLVTTNIGSTVQAYAADLDAISSLSGTSGFLKKVSTGNWSLDTNTYLTSSTGVTSVNGATGAITNVAFTNTAQTFASDVTISGNLTVNGTTVTINSTTVSVDDKNIELGAVTTPTDATANGGGITLKGATDKTIIWDSTNGNWTSSEDWNVASGKSYKVNNVTVLDGTTLGTSVVNSSLTKIGALSGGTAGFVKIDASGNLTSDGTVYAPLNSPGLTGVPTAPTAGADTNTTQLATTEFVVGQASSTTPVVSGTGTVGTSLRYARADHVHPVNTLAQLSGVSISSPVNGQALTYNGTSWVNATPISSLAGLSDVTLSGPVTGQALTYNGTRWVNATPNTALSGLTDVAISAPTNNQVLKYNSASSKWINAADTGTMTASDTAPSSPNPGDIWYDSSVGNVYTYYNDGNSSQWVEIQTNTAAVTTQEMPAGAIMQWSAATPPPNWLICDGSAVSRTTYASLFAVIGVTYGAGDGSTTFNLPDLRGRVPLGAGTVTDQNNNSQTFTLAGKSGELTHVLTVAEMPSHTHVQNSHTHIQDSHGHTFVYGGSNYSGFFPSNASGGNVAFYVGAAQGYGNVSISTAVATNQATTAVNQNTGGGGAHNNLQPYQVVNFIIKYSVGASSSDSQLATRVGVTETVNATQNSRLTTAETNITTVSTALICRLTKSSAQSTSATANTAVAVTWDADTFSTGMWSAGNSTKIFPSRIGKWRVMAKIRISSSTYTYAQVTLNGVNNSPSEDLRTDGSANAYPRAEDYFNVTAVGTDYFTATITSGATSQSLIPVNCIFTAEWIGY